MGPLQCNAMLVLLVMLLTWLVSLRTRDASIIDPVWGLGFVLVVWSSATMRGFAMSGSEWLLVTMTTLWGLRLFLYLAWRKLQEPEEDRRYAVMREHWGARFWWVSLFTIFWLQAVILWFVALPLQFALQASAVKTISSVALGLACCIWGLGLYFESVGDWQLARFKSDPKNQGQVLDQGLWRYTRHPNYFGDFCVWWGLWIASIVLGAPAWSIVCPVVMSIFLMRVSGVNLTEKTIVDRRPEYAEYQRRTSSFFPWPPSRTG